MTSSNIKYYNFPISLLSRFIENTIGTLEDILNWATYDLVKDMEEGTEEERINKAAHLLGYTQEKFYPSMLQDWEMLYTLNKGAMTGISKERYWDYYNSPKTDEQKVCLLAFLAAKSILGNKQYCKTNDLLLFARMNGLDRAFPNEEYLKLMCDPVIKSFYTRRKRDTLRRKLAEEWHINSYSSHTRGYYISRKLSLEKLAEKVETSRKASASAYKDKIALARKKALIRLGKPP